MYLDELKLGQCEIVVNSWCKYLAADCTLLASWERGLLNSATTRTVSEI